MLSLLVRNRSTLPYQYAGGYSQCYSPVSETIWEVHSGLPEMFRQRLPAETLKFVFELIHVVRARQLTGAGE